MSFPLNPTNGQQTQVNGVVYTYSSAKDAWTVGTLFVGNVTVDQINANSVVSAGNISGSYILGNGSQLTGIDATSIQNGTSNVRVLANSNVIVGVAGTANVAVFGTNSLSIAGNISATGNITGSYLLGNGSQLTGLPEGYGNTQVAAYLPTYTGNLAGGNLSISGLSTLTGNVTSSHILPTSTGNFDLGSTAQRWRNIYTNDLNLNNGIGDWTIVEGADDLFLYNNLRNKVYKFALVEVDPEEATPKILKD